MGVVVSPLELLRENDVPAFGSQRSVGRLILNAAQKAGRQTYALIHGSAARGFCDLRLNSDVDVIMYLGSPDVDDGLAQPQRNREWWSSYIAGLGLQFGVKPEHHIYAHDDPDYFLRNGFSDRLFNLYLLDCIRSTRWQRGKLPERLVSVFEAEAPSDQVAEWVARYIQDKITKQEHAPAYDVLDSRVMSIMQRGLEVPGSLKRKLTQFNVYATEVEQPLLASWLSTLDRSEDAVALRSITEQYRRQLVLARRDDITIDDYERWLIDHYGEIRDRSSTLAGRYLMLAEVMGESVCSATDYI